MARSEATAKAPVFPDMIQVEASIVTTCIVPYPLTVRMHVRSIRVSFQIAEIPLFSRPLFSGPLFGRSLFSGPLFCRPLFNGPLFGRTLLCRALFHPRLSRRSRAARWDEATANPAPIPAVVSAAVPSLRQPRLREAQQKHNCQKYCMMFHS